MSQGTRSSRTRRILTVSGVMLAVAAALVGYRTLNGASAAVDPSGLAMVEVGTMVQSVVATGKVEPITKVDIKSKANGIIKVLPVDIDGAVKEGDILAELDKEQLLAARRGAEANLLAARAALEAAEAQLQKNIVEAEGPDVEFARRALERARSLFAQQLIPQSALDDSQSALDVAENKRRAAELQLAVTRARVAEARAQVAQSAAANDRAAEDVANATLIMTIGDIDQVFVRGKVDEADIGRVRLQQLARIRVETFKDKVFTGRVTKVSPMGTEKDNVTSFEVRVSIENPGQELKANMTANAEIVLDEHPNSLLLPEAAISYDAQRHATVELAEPAARNGRRAVSVKLVVGNGTKVQILEGLKAGDQVILPT
ncbi:MAG: HlyD family efflux transporter periplasmic adaptor subunit [Acidimicrobiia bacterium]|nr:HlyD family efflux transporter periplasmic adaptor subunit [Acidimicrobiia bacterium]